MPVAAALRADPRLARDAEALYDVLSDLIRVYQFRDRNRICCHDVSVTQCYALEALERFGPQTVNGLAAHLYLDKSTVSRVVDALERKGLMRRVPRADDRRVTDVRLTAAGRKLRERITREIRDRERRLIEDFDPDVRQAMIELIGRLARAAAERVDTASGSCWSLE